MADVAAEEVLARRPRRMLDRLILEFLQAGGQSVVITAPERLTEALGKNAGTWIVP